MENKKFKKVDGVFYVKVARSDLKKDDLLDYLDKAKDENGKKLIDKIGDGIYKKIDIIDLPKEDLIQLIEDTKDDVKIVTKYENLFDRLQGESIDIQPYRNPPRPDWHGNWPDGIMLCTMDSHSRSGMDGSSNWSSNLERQTLMLMNSDDKPLSIEQTK